MYEAGVLWFGTNVFEAAVYGTAGVLETIRHGTAAALNSPQFTLFHCTTAHFTSSHLTLTLLISIHLASLHFTSTQLSSAQYSIY